MSKYGLYLVSCFRGNGTPVQKNSTYVVDIILKYGRYGISNGKCKTSYLRVRRASTLQNLGQQIWINARETWNNASVSNVAVHESIQKS